MKKILLAIAMFCVIVFGGSWLINASLTPEQREKARLAAAKAEEEKPPPPQPPAPALDIGDIGTINSGSSVVVLASTKDGYDEVSSTIRAKDDVGFRNLVFSGKAFVVDAGTSAKVIDLSFLMRRVRILNGRHKDDAGWLPYEFVK